MTLREKTFSGVRWTTFSALGRAALMFLQIALLARMLSPEDFGLFAIILAIVAFLKVFSDAGISNAIIHFHHITQKQLSSLFWLNVGASILLSLVIVVISPFIAHWYGQPILEGLLWLAALTLVVGAVGQQLRVVAQKNLRFSELAKSELYAAIAGAIVAIALAYLDAGVYSLIVGTLVTTVVITLLAWVTLSNGWRPMSRFRLIEIRKFVKFGLYILGESLANTFNSQVDVLLGGRIIGAQATGLYSVPKDLSLRIGMMINPIVTRVGFPVMAKVKDDEALLRNIYLKTMRMTSSVNFPIYFFLGTYAAEIVHVFLGDKWEEAIPLLQVLAFWALIRSTGNPVGSLLLARGRADLSFKWNVSLMFLIVPAVLMGSQEGALGMAVALMAVSIITFWPNWYFLVRPSCGAKFGGYTLQMFIPFVIALAASQVSYASIGELEGEFFRLALGVSMGSIIYLGMSWWLNRTWVMAMVELTRIDRLFR